MVKIEKHENITVLTLDDGKVNALNEQSLGELYQALEQVKDSRALILTGNGKCFSAGLDLKRLPTLSKPDLLALMKQLADVMFQLLAFPCPVIAAVNGHAIAGGAVLLLCCDQGIGSKQSVKIGLSEVAVGMPLPDLVVELARHKLSPRRLTEAVLFGKLYDWDEAMEAGYLHHAVEPDQLVPQAIGMAQQLCKLPRNAYLMTKQALYKDLPRDMDPEAVGAFLNDQAQQHMAQFKS
jgi:enoyl-CoA hydratase/carnithine racemase